MQLIVCNTSFAKENRGVGDSSRPQKEDDDEEKRTEPVFNSKV